MARCSTCRGSGDATVTCSTCHGDKQTTDVDPNGNGTFIFPGTNVVVPGTLIGAVRPREVTIQPYRGLL
ncbi:hypothetical protein ANO14919_001880 [Xylariales sp. No.14919]|nr:hypothetical protein ANO14919_001880 [Xylariales sp. No.14919]